MRTIHGRPVLANDEEANLVEVRLTCRSEIANLHKEHKELEQQNLQLTGLHTLYLDVQERMFLTFLRDYCRGYRNAHRAETQALNQSVVHGGNVLDLLVANCGVEFLIDFLTILRLLDF